MAYAFRNTSADRLFGHSEPENILERVCHKRHLTFQDLKDETEKAPTQINRCNGREMLFSALFAQFDGSNSI